MTGLIIPSCRRYSQCQWSFGLQLPRHTQQRLEVLPVSGSPDTVLPRRGVLRRSDKMLPAFCQMLLSPEDRSDFTRRVWAVEYVASWHSLFFSFVESRGLRFMAKHCLLTADTRLCHSFVTAMLGSKSQFTTLTKQEKPAVLSWRGQNLCGISRTLKETRHLDPTDGQRTARKHLLSFHQMIRVPRRQQVRVLQATVFGSLPHRPRIMRSGLNFRPHAASETFRRMYVCCATRLLKIIYGSPC